MGDLESHINFLGPEWTAIKRWLLSQREKKVASLIGAKTQEDSDKYRGAISMIDMIVKLDPNRDE